VKITLEVKILQFSTEKIVIRLLARTFEPLQVLLFTLNVRFEDLFQLAFIEFLKKLNWLGKLHFETVCGN
jgi:hypothetical protein